MCALLLLFRSTHYKFVCFYWTFSFSFPSSTHFLFSLARKNRKKRTWQLQMYGVIGTIMALYVRTTLHTTTTTTTTAIQHQRAMVIPLNVISATLFSRWTRMFCLQANWMLCDLHSTREWDTRRQSMRARTCTAEWIIIYNAIHTLHSITVRPLHYDWQNEWENSKRQKWTWYWRRKHTPAMCQCAHWK